MKNQTALPGIDKHFLSARLKESRRFVKKIAKLSGETPLIIQFSGGKDSMAMLGLVREVTDNFVCAYMATGMEFKGVVQFVKDVCTDMGVKLIISNPSMHKGNIFKRIERFQSFPGLIATWCCRDLKLRPEKKMLVKLYGKGTFYKLEGVRRAESSRRMQIYKPYAGNPIRPDIEQSGSFEVFPIINWTDDDVMNYLVMKGLPISGLYNEFGVSGCSWCPFFQPDIYRRILVKLPNHYDRFIEWEEKLNQPSVNGHVFLRDLKREVVEGKAPAPREEIQARTPCMILWEGKMVQTCSVYGHLFIDGKCLRCDEPEVKNV
jgi:phosphoadenosine phosphosulfate reductase